MSKKIVMFSPHAGIWNHSFPEALIAETSKSFGNSIEYIYCSGIFSGYCSVMSAYGLKFTSNTIKKNDACKNCLELSSIIHGEFEFKTHDLKNYINEYDLKRIQIILDGITKENFLDFEYEDIPVGKIALYEMILNLKKNTATFTDSEWSYYLNGFKNSLISLFCGLKIINILKPDVVVLYNSLYSVNNIWRHLADKKAINFYFLHAGVNLAHRLQTLIFAKDCTFTHYKNLVKSWVEFKDVPCSILNIKKVFEHVEELLKGKHFYAYSSPVKKDQFDLYDFFKVEHNQKVFLACLSSNDERYAAELIDIKVFDDYGLYQSQTIWLKELIEYFGNMPEYALIIRVHPREFPNKREAGLSDYAKDLKNLFINLPHNIKINWPTDNISIYQLATQIDVALTSWSSVGKELSLFGLPVITYCPNSLMHSSDLNYWAKNRYEYFQLFETCVAKRFCFDRVRKAFRWYVYEFHLSTLDISDSFNRNELRNKSFFLRIISKLYRIYAPHHREYNDCRARSNSLKSAFEINEIIEKGFDSKIGLLLSEKTNKLNFNLKDETDYISLYLMRIMKTLNGDVINCQKHNSLGKIIYEELSNL